MRATGNQAPHPLKANTLMRILLVLCALLLTGAAAQASCRNEVGAAKAKVYVEHCRDVSPATRPPCNVENALRPHPRGNPARLRLPEERCTGLLPGIHRKALTSAAWPDEQSEIRGGSAAGKAACRISPTLHLPAAGEGGCGLQAHVNPTLVRPFHAAGFSTIRLPSSSTERPVLRASASTEGCQSTLPASGPPMIAISSASGRSPRLRKPR